MSTRNIVLVVDTTAIPEVGRLLAEQGIRLGPVIGQKHRLRCFTVDGAIREPLPIGGLSHRDRVLLQGFADGLGYREIGELLGVRGTTVKNWACQLFRRLNVSDQSSAVAKAYRMGVLDTQEMAA